MTVRKTNPYIDSIALNIGSAYDNESIPLLNTQPKKALELLIKATEIAPKDINFWNNLGSGYYLCAKDYTKAREVWQKVLQMDPNNQKALSNLSVLAKQ
jgi:tetratricopeptide (TPR) repeat protein